MTSLLRACSYCAAALPSRELPPGDPAAGQTSHGICDPCLDDGRHLRAPERDGWETVTITAHERTVISLALIRAALLCDEYAERAEDADVRALYEDDAREARALYVALGRRDDARCDRLVQQAAPLAPTGDQADPLRALVAETIEGMRASDVIFP